MKYNHFMGELDRINILEQELYRAKRNLALDAMDDNARTKISIEKCYEDYPLLIEDKKIVLECSDCGQVLEVNESECIYLGNYENPPEYSEPTLQCNNVGCKSYGKVLNIV